VGWLGAATLSAWAARVGSRMIWDSENTLVFKGGIKYSRGKS